MADNHVPPRVGVDEVLERLGDRPPALFLDFDGTLAEIVPDPEAAAMTDAVRAAVVRAAEVFAVAVVTGRPLDTIIDMVGIEEIAYAGAHGFDLRKPDGEPERLADPAQYEALVAEVCEALQPLDGQPGLIFEHKRSSVAVHYREAAADTVDAVTRAVAALERQHDDLKVIRGKKVFELMPHVQADKGRAVLRLLHLFEVARGPLFPVYFGDDITDEDAFEAIDGSGIGVYVGTADAFDARPPTRASVRVDGPSDVAAVLKGLAERAPRS